VVRRDILDYAYMISGKFGTDTFLERYKKCVMDKPKTNREAYALVIETLGNQSALARGLGVVRQLVSRWDQIPPKYLERTAALTKLPIDWVLPELEASVSALLGRPSALLLPELIRLLINDPKASSWPARKNHSSATSPRQTASPSKTLTSERQTPQSKRKKRR